MTEGERIAYNNGFLLGLASNGIITSRGLVDIEGNITSLMEHTYVKQRSFYLYVKERVLGKEYLFLSYNQMNAMFYYSSDPIRRYGQMPCRYIPVTNPVGVLYTYLPNTGWVREITDTSIATLFSPQGDTSLDWDVFFKKFIFVYHNYDLNYYNNDVDGIITQIGVRNTIRHPVLETIKI